MIPDRMHSPGSDDSTSLHAGIDPVDFVELNSLTLEKGAQLPLPLVRPLEGEISALETGKAEDSGKAHTVEVIKRVPGSRWSFIELLRDKDPHFVQRNFNGRTKHRDKEIIKVFGTDTPHSQDVLLHYAGDPPSGVAKQPVPVILVHGANKNADFWWDPREDESNSGLPQHLRDQGFQVYAVTFPHNQDDNFFWAQELANAINRVKELTGAPQVDLIGHSKGGVPARMYCSDYREPWMTGYQNDVRRLMLVAAPNGGIDYSFRHPICNYALYNLSADPRLNAPMSWDNIMIFGILQDATRLGFSKSGPDYWPGQRQILGRWDKKYPLPLNEPDPYTTYYGGLGGMSYSRGIRHFMKEGGNLIENLRKTPINPSVEVAILAGNKPDIPGIINETSGPSDGLLFLESALDLPENTNLVAEEIMPLNHKALCADRKAYDWIASTLKAPKLTPLTNAEKKEIRRKELGEGGEERSVTSLSATRSIIPENLMAVAI